jgi:hypothetical protein
MQQPRILHPPASRAGNRRRAGNGRTVAVNIARFSCLMTFRPIGILVQLKVLHDVMGARAPH